MKNHCQTYHQREVTLTVGLLCLSSIQLAAELLLQALQHACHAVYLKELRMVAFHPSSQRICKWRTRDRRYRTRHRTTQRWHPFLTPLPSEILKATISLAPYRNWCPVSCRALVGACVRPLVQQPARAILRKRRDQHYLWSRLCAPPPRRGAS